jgi:V8-like Glu-specific endopeptidase
MYRRHHQAEAAGRRASWWAPVRHFWQSTVGLDGLRAPGRWRGTARQAALGAVVLGLALGFKATHATMPGVPDAVTGWASPVGALVTAVPGGRGMGIHFCTASVVDSPVGDLVITAAHCVTGRHAGQFVFVPGYHNRQAPYGIWPVTRVFVDQNWSDSADPDDDVAFLVVRKAGTTTSLQSLTGGERLGLGQRAGQMVRVIGYPDATDVPISCMNQAILFSPTQLQFDCNGYTGGTSGSPLLANVSRSTGLGTVIGVIGGYEQGGYTPVVSYAARLEANAAALYKTATDRP